MTLPKKRKRIVSERKTTVKKRKKLVSERRTVVEMTIAKTGKTERERRDVLNGFAEKDYVKLTFGIVRAFMSAEGPAVDCVSLLLSEITRNP